MTPYVPILPDEIINEILNVGDLGVNMVHLHARNPALRVRLIRKGAMLKLLEG